MSEPGSNNNQAYVSEDGSLRSDNHVSADKKLEPKIDPNHEYIDKVN